MTKCSHSVNQQISPSDVTFAWWCNHDERFNERQGNVARNAEAWLRMSGSVAKIIVEPDCVAVVKLAFTTKRGVKEQGSSIRSKFFA